MKAKYLPNLGAIESSGGADYPYRAKVRREELAGAFFQAVMDVNYSNFKAEVARELGHKREDAYTEVWMALRKLQSFDAGRQPASRRPLSWPHPRRSSRKR